LQGSLLKRETSEGFPQRREPPNYRKHKFEAKYKGLTTKDFAREQRLKNTQGVVTPIK
jgi:hypothetical protein